jgi:hypothetical protein
MAQFIRIVQRILIDVILKIKILYINNLNIKRLRTYYNYAEIVLRIRRFILEYIQNLN